MLVFLEEGSFQETGNREIVLNRDMTEKHLGIKGVIYGDPTKIKDENKQVNKMKTLKSARDSDTVKFVRSVGSIDVEFPVYLFQIFAENGELNKSLFISNLKAGVYKGKIQKQEPDKTNPIPAPPSGNIEYGNQIKDIGEEEPEDLFNLSEKSTISSDPKAEKEVEKEADEEEVITADPLGPLDDISKLIQAPDLGPDINKGNGGELDIEGFESEMIKGMEEASAAGEQEEKRRDEELSLIRLLKIAQDTEDTVDEISGLLLCREEANAGIVEELGTGLTNLKALLENKYESSTDNTDIIEEIKTLLECREQKLTLNISDQDQESIRDVINNSIRGAFEEIHTIQQSVEQPKSNVQNVDITANDLVKISKYRQSDDVKEFIAKASKQGKMSLGLETLETSEKAHGIHSFKGTLPLIEDLIKGDDVKEFVQFMAMHYQYALIEFEQFRRKLDE